ncbi:MAG: DUF3090 family protein [Actinobacteria bacterium]|nr:DUF3090 family protein [Actinomycetota bacterium]
MANQLFDFNQPERFLIGTVGVPGEREFYLQVKGLMEGRKVLASFALEKSQAAALCERIREMVRELKLALSSAQPDLAPLETPIEPEFILGLMSLAWVPEEKLFLFEAQEISSNDLEGLNDESDTREAEGLSMLRVRISLEELGTFAKRTELVVSAGRQPCVFCGGPINPGGHLCPRANGYRRQS